MSTPDVPGHNPANNDVLAMGAWAEHKDGSLILVENTEGGRVIYSIFDLSKTPPVEYRDAVPESSFKTTFSWDPSKPQTDKWTWHDKTQFPWDRVIKKGINDGQRPASGAATLNAAQRIMETHEKYSGETLVAEAPQSAAERVAQNLALRGQALTKDNLEHRLERTFAAFESVLSRIADSLSNLPKKKKKKDQVN